MPCPRCQGPMDEHRLDGHSGSPIVIDMCPSCQAFWFDTNESPRLSPGSTLALFGIIGAHPRRTVPLVESDVAKCPRCGGRLRATSDRQRDTVFSYLRCPNGHGRLTSFIDFLREKDFVKPLTPSQLAHLRSQLTLVHCSACGAAVDLSRASACQHCGAPLSTLDLPHADRVVARLQQAEHRRDGSPVDPTLPLRLAQARREVDLAFEGLDAPFRQDASSAGLVAAALAALGRWLSRAT